MLIGTLPWNFHPDYNKENWEKVQLYVSKINMMPGYQTTLIRSDSHFDSSLMNPTYGKTWLSGLIIVETGKTNMEKNPIIAKALHMKRIWQKPIDF